MSSNLARAPNESTVLLKGTDNEVVKDASLETAGIVVSGIEEAEHSRLNNYGSVGGLIQPVEETVISPKRLRIVMYSLYMGIFLAALDQTIVSTLMAHIASEFGALPKISWVATAYLLSSATFQPLYGKVSDIFGRKSVLLFCNTMFLLGCLLCGVSSTFYGLVFGRFIAGVGGGGFTSMSSITVSDVVPLRNRGLYQGICNLFFGLGTAFGGVIGGFFTETAGGWRMAFLMQVPLALMSAITIYVYLELPRREKLDESANESSIHKLKQIDWFGSGSLVVFLLLFMFASSSGGRQVAYTSTAFISLCFGALLFAGTFVYIELNVSKNPILPLQFLKDRSVSGASCSNFFCMMAIMAIGYYLPIYFASVLDMAPSNIGKRLIPSFFSNALGSLGTGYYIKKTGKYYWFVIFAGLLGSISMLQLVFISPDISVWRQYILIFFPAVGAATLITVALLAMIAAVPHEFHAVTTSISYLFRSTGSTLGVTLAATTFRETLNRTLIKRVLRFEGPTHTRAELETIIAYASRSPEWVHKSAPKFVLQTLLDCYQTACVSVFAFCLICTALATLSFAFVEEKPLHKTLNRTSATH